MNLAKVALVAALSAALFACAGIGGVRTVRGDWTGYSLKYLHYAASRGSLPTIVSGGAPGAAPAAVEAKVLAELSARPLGVGPIAFVPYPQDQAARPPLYVSMVFDPEPSFDSADACDPARARTAGGASGSDGTTRVVAAFCSSQRLLSGSVGYADGLSGLDDPRFSRLIQLLAIDLFPPRDPDQSGCSDCP